MNLDGWLRRYSTVTTGGTSPTGAGALASGVQHVPILHLATSLPAPAGDVATVMHLENTADQRTHPEAFFVFLNATSPDLSCLNEGRTRFVALVSVPKTSLVKVVCGLSYGSSPIGATASAIDGKLLFLQGDGNADIGPLQPICLPATMVVEQQVATMTAHQFSVALTGK